MRLALLVKQQFHSSSIGATWPRLKRVSGTLQKRSKVFRSLEIGVRLFQDLNKLARPASLSELSKISRMPPAKVHRYCVSLIRTGLMVQDGRGRYGVGPYGFQLTTPGVELEHACSLAFEMLPDLVRGIGETAFVSSWGQTGPHILKVQNSSKPISIRPNSRGDLPLWNSATGRVFAAFMAPKLRDSLIEAEFRQQKRDEKLSLTKIAARRAIFEKNLTDVRNRLISRTTGERYPGLVSFAVPVFDRHRNVILALTSFGFGTTLPTSWDGVVPKALLAAAAELTKRIGGATPD